MNSGPIRKNAAAELRADRSRLAPSLLDVVELLEPLPAHGLPTGAAGTVVEELSDAFLVEFVDEAGDTLALEVLKQDQLKPVKSILR